MWWVVVIAFWTVEVVDDLLFGITGGCGFEVHSAEGAEQEVAGVSHYGGAPRGDTVLRLEEEESGEESVDVGGGLKFGEVAEEIRGEGGMGEAGGGAGAVTRAEAGMSVAGFVAAPASGGGAMAAAGESCC